MVFKCQEDSFLKEFSSKVIKCEPTKEPIVNYGKKTNFQGYQITLEDTILFPAGGGQPHDTGFLNNVEVLQVLRKGGEALHFTKEPIEVGTIVEQKIDWDRRFDHMQQHSGQHLLSALLEKQNLNTTSWWLGAEESYIELDSTNVTDDIIKATENQCNELIRAAVPVNVKICKADDPELNEAHTRGLPKDCMDTIRIICIGDIDENMCCGTHVSNLSQLQVIKLTEAEPGKKGKTNLKFLVGNRVIKTLHDTMAREKLINKLLQGSSPSQHVANIQKLQKRVSVISKNYDALLQDISLDKAEKVNNTVTKPKYIFLFNKIYSVEFMRTFMKSLNGDVIKDIFMVLATENLEKSCEGQIFILGPEEHSTALTPKIIDILQAKGAFRNGVYQGKIENMSGIEKCKKMIEEYFKM